MQAVLIHRERITDSGNTTLAKTTINGEYMCCLLSLQNWNVPLALTFLLTGFVQSLEFFQTWKKSGKWRKSLEKWLMMDLSFFFKFTTHTRRGGGGGGRGVLRLLSKSNQRYRVTIRPCVPPLVCLNLIAGLLSAPTFVYLLTFEFGCSKGEWR